MAVQLACAVLAISNVVSGQLITAAPPPDASITPSPTVKQRRDIQSRFDSLEGDLSSALGGLPSYVASGIPQFWENLPTGTQVLSILGVNETRLMATPTSVLNLVGPLSPSSGLNADARRDHMRIGQTMAGMCASTGTSTGSVCS